MPNGRDIVEKADIAVSNLVSDGGYLNPEQSDKFIDIVIDQPTLLNRVRTVKMNAPKKKIEKLGFGSRILNAAPASGSYLDSGLRSKPDLGTVDLDTKEILAEVWIPYDVLEDNIEHESMEDTIMRHIAQRTALDLEELLINGNEIAGSPADPYLELMDGALLMSDNSLVDGTGLGYGSTLWKAIVEAMPTKYLRNINLMNFFISHFVEHEYRAALAARETGLGDALITGRQPVYGFGVKMDACALMPNSNALFTYPQNIIWGVQRDIMIETDRDIRARVIQIVLTLRCDFVAETADAIVVAENIGAS